MNGKFVIVGYFFGEQGANLVLDDINTTPTQRLNFPIYGKNITIKNLSIKYCIGSHDLKSGKSAPCPNKEIIQDIQYDSCFECFNKTGFNPAFYNSNNISDQQKEYNKQSHIVYLANFGYGYNKVGISNEKRGINRLLEQGARSAIILDNFENANKAREIEYTISKYFHQISETFRDQTKRKLILEYYNYENCKNQLTNLIEKIENYIGIKFIKKAYINCDEKYYYKKNSNITIDYTFLSNYISGNCIGMIGSTIILENNNRNYLYSIKEIIGNLIDINDNITEIEPIKSAQQIGLF